MTLTLLTLLTILAVAAGFLVTLLVRTTTRPENHPLIGIKDAFTPALEQFRREVIECTCRIDPKTGQILYFGGVCMKEDFQNTAHQDRFGIQRRDS